MKAAIVPSTNQPAFRRSLAVTTVKQASRNAATAMGRASCQPIRMLWATAPRIRVAAGTRRARNSGSRANSNDTRTPNTAAIASGLK